MILDRDEQELTTQDSRSPPISRKGTTSGGKELGVVGLYSSVEGNGGSGIEGRKGVEGRVSCLL